MSKRDARNIWVVEMHLDGQWPPTTETSLTRELGRSGAGDLHKANPADHFRLRRYVPAKKTRCRDTIQRKIENAKR